MWSNSGKRVVPSFAVANEKGVIGSPSTTVTNFTYIYTLSKKKSETYSDVNSVNVSFTFLSLCFLYKIITNISSSV